MAKIPVLTDDALRKAQAEERHAKEATLAQQRRLAQKQRKVQALLDAQRHARLMQLGTLVEAAGFRTQDHDFLVQALAWLKVMRDDPERWEMAQGGMVEDLVEGGKR